MKYTVLAASEISGGRLEPCSVEDENIIKWSKRIKVVDFTIDNISLISKETACELIINTSKKTITIYDDYVE